MHCQIRNRQKQIAFVVSVPSRMCFLLLFLTYFFHTLPHTSHRFFCSVSQVERKKIGVSTVFLFVQRRNVASVVRKWQQPPPPPSGGHHSTHLQWRPTTGHGASTGRCKQQYHSEKEPKKTQRKPPHCHAMDRDGDASDQW